MTSRKRRQQVEEAQPLREQTNEYEAARERKIQANRNKMKELGIPQLSQELEKELRPTKTPKKRQPKPALAQEARHCARHANNRKDYREEKTLPPELRLQRPRIPRPLRPSNRPDLDPVLAKLADKAFEAAERKAEEVGGAVKMMAPSITSGGFWCTVPNAIYHAWPNNDTKHEVIFKCSEDPRPGSAFRCETEEESRTWRVVWLPRSTAGFSGGWRGFAEDQALTQYDSVVFAVRKPATKGKKPPQPFIEVFIFRAEDYRSPASESGAEA